MSKCSAPFRFATGKSLPTFLVTFVMFGPDTLFRYHLEVDGSFRRDQLTPWGDNPDLELRGFFVRAEWPDGEGMHFAFDVKQAENIEHARVLEEILARVAGGESPRSAYLSAMEGEPHLYND